MQRIAPKAGFKKDCRFGSILMRRNAFQLLRPTRAGAHTHTTSSEAWLSEAGESVSDIIDRLWEQVTSGKSAIMHVEDMKPDTKLIWEAFKAGRINAQDVVSRLEIMRPIIERQNVN